MNLTEIKKSLEESRIVFRPIFSCDHKSICSKDPFSICYGCGEPRWKCEIDIAQRTQEALNKIKE